MDEKQLKHYNITISGRVQGVGFRFYVLNKAQKYGINGFVRNNFDNTVEIDCESQNHLNLDLFIKEIKQGPLTGHITSFNINEIKTPINYKSFDIEY